MEKQKKVKEIKPFDQVKLLFSTLFARQMNSIIVGADPQNDNVLYFSNIELNEVDMYEQDASKYIHRVTVYNRAIVDSLYEICPLMKDHVLYINSRAFLSALSKEIKNNYCFEITETNALVLTTDKLHYPVGEMISTYLAGLYVEIFELGAVTEQHQYRKTLTSADVNAIRINMIDAFNNEEEERPTKVVLTPAKNFVSLKEYPAKTKNDQWVLILKVFGDRVCKIECDFNTNDIKVESVQPGIRFYCKRS